MHFINQCQISFNLSATVHVALLSTQRQNTSPIEKWVVQRNDFSFFFWQSIHGPVHTQLHILPLILWDESSCLVSATTADLPHSLRQSMGIQKSTGTQLPRLSALSANDCLIVGSRDLRFLLLLHRILSDRVFLTVAQEQFTWSPYVLVSNYHPWFARAFYHSIPPLSFADACDNLDGLWKSQRSGVQLPDRISENMNVKQRKQAKQQCFNATFNIYFNNTRNVFLCCLNEQHKMKTQYFITPACVNINNLMGSSIGL